MFKKLLIKDLQLMLRDFRVHIFAGLILFLFLLSAIFANQSYKNSWESHQSTIERYSASYASQTKHMINLLSGNITYVKQPSESVLIYKKNGFPETISTTTSYFTPWYGNFTNEGRIPFSLNWLFIIGMIGSFSCLLFSYNAISREKMLGTLRLQSISGMSRFQIFLSKFLSNFVIINGIVLISALFSFLLFTLLQSGFSHNLFLEVLLTLAITPLYLAFFIIIGIVLSMFFDSKTGIVMMVTAWLIFLVIIPNGTSVFVQMFKPTPTNSELIKKSYIAYQTEFKKWNDKYGTKVGGDGNLEEGFRSDAFFSSFVKRADEYKKGHQHSFRQYELVENISLLSPYSILEQVLTTLLDSGFFRLNREIEQFSNHRDYVEKKLKDLDAKDEKSLHLWYQGASFDYWPHREKVPFSRNIYKDKNDLILSQYNKASLGNKLSVLGIHFLILVSMNIATFIFAFLKINKYDIR